jgi:protein-S-isoprenylcysteine O-methyltransferase Ste14
MMTLPLIQDAPALHLAFASLHLVAGQGLSGWLYRRRFGRSPLVLYKPGLRSPHMRVTRAIGAASLIWAAALIGYALWPAMRASVVGGPLFAPPMLAGWLVASAGLVWMVAAQADMGASFRVGQDEQESTALVTGGMHALSRNPIYVGSFVCLAGLSLWAPCPLVLASCALIGALMHALTLAEERHLASVHGQVWRDYIARTRRYL